jgi:protein-S-isoprenylcysteine O-methyltransferase Ste14
MSQQERRAGLGGLVFAMVFYSILVVIFMFSSGNWLWTEGLVFSGWFLVLCQSLTIWLYIKNPCLFAERLKPNKGNQKLWDKVFVALLELVFLGWLVLQPLDASRFHWSPLFPVWLKVIGGIMLFPSAILFVKSYIDNPYLSAVVRIQDDRNQKVVSTGVYRFVRHPMYLGGFLFFVGMPLLLGSLVGVAFAVMFIIGFVFRILGEEKMLTQELEGYTEYTTRVKYRIFPYIW